MSVPCRNFPEEFPQPSVSQSRTKHFVNSYGPSENFSIVSHLDEVRTIIFAVLAWKKKKKKKDGTTCGLAYVSAAVYRRVMANITSSLLKTLSLYIRDWVYDWWGLAITSLSSTDDLCHRESNLLECHSQKKCFLSIIHAETKYILKKKQQKLNRTYEISHDLIWIQFRNNFVLFKVHVEDIFPISKLSANIQELPHLTLKVVWVTVLPWLITLGSHLEQKL